MSRLIRWLLSFWMGAILFLPAFSLAASTGKKLSGVLNLNTATLEQLVLLPGVGPATARNIIETRQARPFEQPWEVVRAKGIGPKTFRKLEPYLRVSGENTLRLEESEKKKKEKKSRKTRRRRPIQARGPLIIDLSQPAPTPSSAPTASR